MTHMSEAHKFTLLIGYIQMKKITLGSIFGFLFISSTTIACFAPNWSLFDREKSKTNLYAGLNWDLDGGATPALVLGAFRTKVETDGDTKGGNLSLDINLKNKIKPSKLKLSFLKGQENLQGEIGFGYNFLKSKPLVLLGVNVPYVSAGIDVYSNPGIVPFAQLHTKGNFDKPGQECKFVGGALGQFEDANCTVTPAPPPP